MMVSGLCRPRYRGLSGIGSALFAALGVVVGGNAATRGHWKASVLPIALLAGFIAKTAFEAVTETTIFVDSVAAGTAAVPIAHVAGAVTGVVAGMGELLARRRRGWAETRLEDRPTGQRRRHPFVSRHRVNRLTHARCPGRTRYPFH